MELALLLDENIEPALGETLAKSGHDVERVVDVTELGEGATDAEICAHAVETSRIIVTSDDDFVRLPADEHSGVFYVPDQQLSASELYRIIQCLTDAYPSRKAIQPVTYLTTDWL